MKNLLKNTTTTLTAALAFALFLPAADQDGCNQDEVIIGDDAGDGGSDGGSGGQGGTGGDTGTTCYIGGCSSEVCSDDPNIGSTCEYMPEYICYDLFGVCNADAATGDCGWVQSQDLLDCIAERQEERTAVEEACIRDNDDACETDADCMAGGCGGDLCFNPAVSQGNSTCECTAPTQSCGCVDGTCSWYE